MIKTLNVRNQQKTKISIWVTYPISHRISYIHLPMELAVSGNIAGTVLTHFCGKNRQIIPGQCQAGTFRVVGTQSIYQAAAGIFTMYIGPGFIFVNN